jgi:hypothetical protein
MNCVWGSPLNGARRWMVARALILTVAFCCVSPLQLEPWPARPRLSDAAILDDLAERTFRYFWETAHPATGLAPDRYPTKSFSSIAAVGFALTAYPIGAERGWVSRAAARDRTLAVLRFLAHLPHGPERVGRAGYRGFFHHFL